MSKADATHFDSYRDQTRTKHRILAGYLPAYYNAMKAYQSNLVYIDGFAGRGSYTDSAGHIVDGSPVLAMKLFAARDDFRQKIMCYFIEPRDDHFAALRAAVNTQQAASPLTKRPSVTQATFQQFSVALAEHLKGTTEGLAPTFLFVDPCGVEGVRMQDIVHILARPRCEVFVFFNYEGVNRIAGLAVNSGGSQTLADLFGNAERVTNLLATLHHATDADLREQVILNAFESALTEDSGAKFMLRFRVESEGRRATSHYFLYATKHELGFKIMKDVMWEASRAALGGDEGGLHLLQASRGVQGLFRPAHLADQEAAVLAELAGGPRPVKLFREDWVLRPTDLYSEGSYRRCLLRLEQSGQLDVLDEDGQTPLPAIARRPYRGEPTLASRLWVRLRR